MQEPTAAETQPVDPMLQTETGDAIQRPVVFAADRDDPPKPHRHRIPHSWQQCLALSDRYGEHSLESLRPVFLHRLQGRYFHRLPAADSLAAGCQINFHLFAAQRTTRQRKRRNKRMGDPTTGTPYPQNLDLGAKMIFAIHRVTGEPTRFSAVGAPSPAEQIAPVVFE